MRFKDKIDQMGFSGTPAAESINAALEKFATSANDNPNAVGWLMQNLSAQPRSGERHKEIRLHISFFEIDYTFGTPVYSVTPRLLLKVPDQYRNPNIENTRIEHDELGPKQNVPRLGYGGAPLPKDAVIVFPNQEGEQPRVEDRPVVQWSGIKPGEYMILGKFNAGDEDKIKGIIESVIGASPEGRSIWQHYESKATIDDLSDIMIALRKAGFSNQYDTKAKYLDTAGPLDGKKDYTPSAGLYCRDRDKEMCSAVYIPGEIDLGFHPRELINDGGFVIAIKAKNSSDLSYRPVSTGFAAINYRHQFTDTPLCPIPNVINIWFPSLHPLRPYANEVSAFLKDMHAVNVQIRDAQNDYIAGRADNAHPDRAVRQHHVAFVSPDRSDRHIRRSVHAFKPRDLII